MGFRRVGSVRKTKPLLSAGVLQNFLCKTPKVASRLSSPGKAPSPIREHHPGHGGSEPQFPGPLNGCDTFLVRRTDVYSQFTVLFLLPVIALSFLALWFAHRRAWLAAVTGTGMGTYPTSR